MKHIFTIIIFGGFWGHLSAQVIAVSDSFTIKLAKVGLTFAAPKAGTSGENNRMRAKFNCNLNEKLGVDATYQLKGEKKMALICYRITELPIGVYKLTEATNSYVKMVCSTSVAALSEGDASLDSTKSVQEISQTLHADWACVSKFTCQKTWKTCHHFEYGYHIFVFKAGKGYAEIMVFYDAQSQEFVTEELSNIITSISFQGK